MKIFYKLRNWYNKHFNFDKYFNEYCKENYCSKCKDKNKDCFVDYVTGKCYINK